MEDYHDVSKIHDKYCPSYWVESIVRLVMKYLVCEPKADEREAYFDSIYLVPLGGVELGKICVPPAVDKLYPSVKPERLFDVLHGALVRVSDGFPVAIPAVLPSFDPKGDSVMGDALFLDGVGLCGGLGVYLFLYKGRWYAYTDSYQDTDIHIVGDDWWLGSGRLFSWMSRLWLVNPVWCFKYRGGVLYLIGVRDMGDGSVFIPASEFVGLIPMDGISVGSDFSVLAAKPDADSWYLSEPFVGHRYRTTLDVGKIGERYCAGGRFVFYELMDVTGSYELFAACLELEREFMSYYLREYGVIMYDDVRAFRGFLYEQVLRDFLRGRLQGSTVEYDLSFRSYWYGYDLLSPSIYGRCVSRFKGKECRRNSVGGKSVSSLLRYLERGG